MSEGRALTSPVKAASVFGSLAFNDKAQQERLPKPVYRALRATITRGEPTVTDVAVNGHFNRDEALRLAASAERGSEHPLGQSIANAYADLVGARGLAPARCRPH